MTRYLLVCRSLTQAQRTVKTLGKHGISGQLRKLPQILSENGCGYGVQIPQTQLSSVLVILNQAGMSPTKVYMEEGAQKPVQVIP